MINLIIVDDEETTRDSLVELIPWNELGIHSIKSAKNGIDALEVAENFTPSIMLCDVKMPKMDGIELSKRVRQLYPNCEIIFLSGFSDKEYLKSAIKVNAIDYLEKPVDFEELKSVFQRTIQKLQLNNDKAAEEKKLKSSLVDNIHLIRQEILLELISGKADQNTLKNKYGPDVFQFTTEGVFTVISVVFNWFTPNSVKDISLFKISILKILNSNELFRTKRLLSGFTDNNHLILTINHDTRFTKAELKSLLNSLFDMLKGQSYGNFSFSAGVSTPVLEINILPEVYKVSLEAINQQFYKGINQVYYPVKTIPLNYKINNAVYSKFKKLLRSNSVTEAITVVSDLTEDISESNDPDIIKIKNIYFNFLRILLEVTMQWDTLESTEDNENKYIWQEVDSQVTLAGLSDLTITYIKTFFNKSADKEASFNKINEIIKYIMEHSSDNQLSIQSIAEYAALSQTYLCAFFKKSTSKTLNEYITELRIEKAKELIEDNTLKLYEVTSRIGFSDVNYFSSLFKKHTGLTPSEFREKKLYDKKTV